MSASALEFLIRNRLAPTDTPLVYTKLILMQGTEVRKGAARAKAIKTPHEFHPVGS